MSTINKILLSSADLVINKSQDSDRGFSNLKVDQILKARVIKVVSAREALLLLLGKKISAKTHAPLTQGDDILLKVSRAGKHPVFKLVEGRGVTDTQFLFGKMKALGRSGPFEHLSALLEGADRPGPGKGEGGSQQLPDQMKSLLQETALKSGAPDPGVLNRFIRKSGLVWEHKLTAEKFPGRVFLKDHLGHLKGQDMKAIAMDILASLKESEGELTGRLNAFVENTETLQLLNRQLFEETGKYLLHFPALFGSRMKFGQMLIDLNKNRNDDKTDDNNLVRVAFLLELTNLGDFFAEFSILKDAVSGSFRVMDDYARALIVDHLPDLKTRLTAHGFEVRHMECRVVRPDTLAGISLLDNIADEGEGLLNLVV